MAEDPTVQQLRILDDSPFDAIDLWIIATEHNLTIPSKLATDILPRLDRALDTYNSAIQSKHILAIQSDQDYAKEIQERIVNRLDQLKDLAGVADKIAAFKALANQFVLNTYPEI